MNNGILAHQHAVQFYGTDASLYTTVGSFLAEGLIAGQPALVIATADHRPGILDQLQARLIDIDKAERLGELVILDASEILDQCLIGELPDPRQFERHVGHVLERMRLGRADAVIRAYGEMVDVLWKQGRPEAAIRLEILWNKLAARFGFALLCGYSMGNFLKAADGLQQDIRAQHTHVIDEDTGAAEPTTRGVN
jgi:DcmR-like sensory protein